MQFHLNGYRTGDPNIAPEADRSGESFDIVDVLIVGCGPAGLTLAAQMSAFADVNTRIIDVKSGPLTVGQADGVACRSMEMFQAFGFAEQVKQEAYWVNEVAFWRPADTGDVGLTRANRIQDVEDNLSEMPHTILNQARIHDFYLDIMQQSPRRLVPDYGRSLLGLKRDDTKDYPIEATLELADGSNEVIHAHYVVGCDGARSNVRRALGYELKGEAARQLWGVMDVLAVTDFPDIRLKAAIQSADQGSMLIIPREGGYMVRLYIEVGELHEDERAADRKLTIEELIEKAQLILSPYQLGVKDVVWWSAYEIGQRVCDSFDDVASENGLIEPRIFIAGDACHTHSPKAGQGMNVSMADTFNLGWKLAAVVRKQASKALLNTYSQERQSKAQELIDFDRDMARLFSAKSSIGKSSNTADAEQFQQYFKKHGRFTAGVETQYQPSIITGHTEYQALAQGFPIGKRFHSAPVIRLADAKPVELGHVMKADGRWRLMVFSPKWMDHELPATILALCDYLLSNTKSPVVQYTPANTDIDSVIDVRMVLQENHRHVSVDSLPELLLPRKGRYGLIDYEKVFCANVGSKGIVSEGVGSGGDVFNIRGIDRENGALIVVRPDQYVSGVLPLSEFALLEKFFAGFQTVSA